MAIKWSEGPYGARVGRLNGQMIFSVQYSIERGSSYILRSTLPGNAAAELDRTSYASVRAAQEAAVVFMRRWLYTYTQAFEKDEEDGRG